MLTTEPAAPPGPIGRLSRQGACVGLVLIAVVALPIGSRGDDADALKSHLQGALECNEAEFSVAADGISVQASGNVVLQVDGGVLTADSLSYKFKRDQGQASGELLNGRAKFGGLILSGKRVSFDGPVYHVENGGLTTCDRPRPHYLFSARRIEATVGQEAVLHGAALYLYGVRLLSLGRYRKSLRPTRGSMLPIPIPGYSRIDSFYVAGSRAVRLGQRSDFASVDLLLSTKRGPRGTVSVFRRQGEGRAGIRLSRRAGVADELTASLTLDRFPEAFASWPWTVSKAAKLNMRADISVGSYSEHPTSAEASRANVKLGLEQGVDGNEKGVFGGLRYRKSWYSNSSSLEVLESELGIRSQPNRKTFGEVAFIHRASHGSTPFEFDDVDVPNELRVRLELDTGKFWALGAAVRYDTAASEVMDQTLSLTRKVHCLTYTLKWHQLTGDFGVGIGLVGF